MMEKQEKRRHEYPVNLLLLADDGSFQCPKCGLTISPEDDTNKNYKIIETKVLRGELVALIIVCGKCQSKLRLTGFQPTKQ